jgi:putative hemolysin
MESFMRDLPQPTLALADLRAPRRRLMPQRQPVLPIAHDSVPAPAPQAAMTAAWATTPQHVEQAQRLRHQVFVEEMGARLNNIPGTPPGLDRDIFDAHCDHLLVRSSTGDVIGTYRVMTPTAARRMGGWYSETEFDFTRLRHHTATMAELGRSCVHPDHRNGGVIMTLWAALGDFMRRNQLDTMVGCASISMRDGGHVAASVWEQLRQTHLAPIEHHVQPRLALPVDELNKHLPVETPALIKGYLRCGAKVLGPPAWDPDFNTADLPMMLRLCDLPSRYQRHFMGAATA